MQEEKERQGKHERTPCFRNPYCTHVLLASSPVSDLCWQRGFLSDVPKYHVNAGSRKCTFLLREGAESMQSESGIVFGPPAWHFSNPPEVPEVLPPAGVHVHLPRELYKVEPGLCVRPRPREIRSPTWSAFPRATSLRRFAESLRGLCHAQPAQSFAPACPKPPTMGVSGKAMQGWGTEFLSS